MRERLCAALSWRYGCTRWRAGFVSAGWFGTRRYIQDFGAAAEKATGYQELYDAMVALYPDRLNRGVLWNSAKSVMG